jgi:predicted metal-binding protein
MGYPDNFFSGEYEEIIDALEEVTKKCEKEREGCNEACEECYIYKCHNILIKRLPLKTIGVNDKKFYVLRGGKNNE